MAIDEPANIINPGGRVSFHFHHFFKNIRIIELCRISSVLFGI